MSNCDVYERTLTLRELQLSWFQINVSSCVGSYIIFCKDLTKNFHYGICNHKKHLFLLNFIIDFMVIADTKIVVAWWGQDAPPLDHILSESPEVNSMVCFPQEEDTMITEETDRLGWLTYMLKQSKKKVALVYSAAGKQHVLVANYNILCTFFCGFYTFVFVIVRGVVSECSCTHANLPL